MKVDLSCPIELWEYKLPTKDTPACSFTFFNLDERPISSIQISVTCYDDKNDVTSRRVERPMALEADGRAPFTVQLPTDGLEVESIDLVIDKAWYEDGHEWRRAQEARLVDYQPNELPPNRRQEQLRYIAGPDAVGYPSDQRNVWICVCGRVNAAEERYCRRCEREKEEVFARFSFEAVQEAIDQREHELEEKAKQAREEASRQEFLRQERARHRKRNRRMRTGIICIVLVLAATSYLFVVLGLPELRYQTALSALAAGDPAAAKVAFVELLDYRDALEKVKECDMQIAVDYAQSGDEEQVNTAIAMLRDLGDYPGAVGMVDEATYQKALLRMEKNDYAAAGALFSDIASYRDAEDMRRQCDYQIATQMMTSGDYEGAAERFSALGNYFDAAVQANECVYRPAVALMTQGKYDEAAEMLATIVGYSDASEQHQQAVYMSAMRAQSEGDYEYAAERFMMLGSYGDASEQMRHSVYLAANAARDSGKYETAGKLYATIPDYEDAKEQERACIYLPAVALMTEGDYAAAAEMFLEIDGYKDAGELYEKCLYNPALIAIDEAEYEDAIALLEQIPNYPNADKLLDEAKYLRAAQMEESGYLDAAIEAFTALGDYSDAPDRILSAKYQKAELLLVSGDFVTATDEFEALGTYKDSATRVKECAYEQAMLSRDEDDLQTVYDALTAITGYAPAQEAAREVAYAMGEASYENGDMSGAANAFALAGEFQDAPERHMACVYQEALNLRDEKKYQEAGELFNSISGYKDAKGMRDETYDLWLSDFLESARALYEAKQYDKLLPLFGTMDVESLPSAYAELRTMYYESNISMARKLVAEDQSLEAYKYLIACNGYKNSTELLDKNIYKLLGTWDSEGGAHYAFYLNGTCVIDGEEYFFNMKDAYGIFTGKTKDELERTHSFSNGSENVLTLTVDASGKKIRFTRVKQAEVSPNLNRTQTQAEEETELETETETEPQDSPGDVENPEDLL